MVDWYCMCKKSGDLWCMMAKYVYMMVIRLEKKPSSFRHRAWKLLIYYIIELIVEFVERKKKEIKD